MRGSWASIPHAGESPIFLDWTFEHQFNSSSRILSEETGKLVMPMGGLKMLWWALITDDTIKFKLCTPMSHTVA